jgi:hypothetical protein
MNIPKTRICFGIFTVPEDNMFIHIHHKYPDQIDKHI